VSNTLGALQAAQEPIRAAHARWVAEDEVDVDALRASHDDATLAAHRHYCATVPAYRSLAEGLGLVDCADAALLRAELSSTEDLFKSYDPRWLDEGDFTAMTGWLGQICSADVTLEATGIDSIEGWLGALRGRGLEVMYTSGTSGLLSFVPRDDDAAAAFALFASTGIFEFAGASPEDYDGFLLAFQGGNHSLAWSADRMGMRTRSAEFLYELPTDADAIRAQVTGQVPAVASARDACTRLGSAIAESPRHRERMIAGLLASADAGRPTLLLAAPFQLMELCRELIRRGERIEAHARSFVVLGGGWKSFQGERIPREELVAMVGESLGVGPASVHEAYGMSECSAVAFRCIAGRFHVPPLVCPLVFDDALEPLQELGRGRLGFSDPFATSYPGLFITGDEVELTLDPCSCGRQGFSIVGEITRAPGREAKGCGGVMASMRA